MCWSQLEHGTMKKLRKNLHEPALDGEEKKLALEKLLGYIKVSITSTDAHVSILERCKSFEDRF